MFTPNVYYTALDAHSARFFCWLLLLLQGPSPMQCNTLQYNGPTVETRLTASENLLDAPSVRLLFCCLLPRSFTFAFRPSMLTPYGCFRLLTVVFGLWWPLLTFAFSVGYPKCSLVSFFFLWLAVGPAAAPLPAALEAWPWKNPQGILMSPMDKRHYRWLLLPNGLKVLRRSVNYVVCILLYLKYCAGLSCFRVRYRVNAKHTTGIRRCTSHTPLGRFSELDWSTTKRVSTPNDASSESALVEMLSTPTFVAPTLFRLPLVEISTMENRPKGVC